MIITLVRHGEVDEAYHRCYNGHNDISLSQQGREEAQQLAQLLKESSFDAIYSSDLRRCQETLSPILDQLQPSYSNALKREVSPIIFTEQLREKSWGRHEGMTFDAIVKEEGLEYHDFEQWIHALDGEDYEVYMQRIKTFFRQTLPKTGYNRVLVMTHAGVIRLLIHLLENISLQEAFSINFPYGAYTTLDTNTWKFGETQCLF